MKTAFTLLLITHTSLILPSSATPNQTQLPKAALTKIEKPSHQMFNLPSSMKNTLKNAGEYDQKGVIALLKRNGLLVSESCKLRFLKETDVLSVLGTKADLKKVKQVLKQPINIS